MFRGEGFEEFLEKLDQKLQEITFRGVAPSKQAILLWWMGDNPG